MTPFENDRGGSARAGRSVLLGLFLWSVFAVVVPVKAGDLPRFVDMTGLAGIRFIHNNGAFGKKYLPETLGPGCAFIDFDNDGWPDILLVNGKDWPGHRRRASTL